MALFQSTLASNSVPDFMILPVMRNIRGVYLLGDNPTRSIINLVDPTKPLSIVGNPTFSPGYVGCKRFTDYFDTGLPEEDSMTLICVGRSSAAFVNSADRPGFIGNGGTSSQYATGHGLALTVNSSAGTAPRGNLALRASYLNSGTPASQVSQLDIADLSAWRAFGGTIGPGVNETFYDLTGGQTATAFVAGRTRARNIDKTLKIGSDDNAGGAPCDISIAMVFGTVLTPTEMTGLIKPLLSGLTLERLGVTV